ncbi:DUF1674 domain-containing protein [Xanthobacter tagetidis]|nr:hypothetical protein [Xanthobacter tagetidis]
MSGPMADETSTPPAAPGGAPGKVLSEAAKRALAEAQARRAAIDAAASDRPKELNGRNGPEPVRYGDWEVGGIATDF